MAAQRHRRRDAAGRADGRRTPSARASLRREPAPARRALRRPGTTGRHGARAASSRARRCPSRTGSMSTQRGRSSPSSRSPPACIIKHTNPCGFAVGENAVAPIAARTSAIRAPRMAASSASTGRSTSPQRKRSPRRSSRRWSAPASTTTQRRTSPPSRGCACSSSTGHRVAEPLDVRSIDGGLARPDARPCGHRPVDHDCGRARVSPTKRSGATSSSHGGSAAMSSRTRWSSSVTAWRWASAPARCPASKSSELAVARAGDRSAGAVSASDAFFPMPDGLETLGNAGVRSVIHPGRQQERPRGHRGRGCPGDGGRARRGTPLPALTPRSCLSAPFRQSEPLGRLANARCAARSCRAWPGPRCRTAPWGSPRDEPR